MNKNQTKEATILKWELFVSSGVSTTTSTDLAPGTKLMRSSPTSSTLIYGEHDAVLVDTLMTIDESDFLVDWINSSGRNLKVIYITHGHGDHFFGNARLMESFPNAKIVATHGTVEHMKKHISPESLKSYWNNRFPGQIPENIVFAEELKGNIIELEGNELVAVEVGHTDTHDTTVLHIPSIGLVVAGDAAYNGVHLFLAETDHNKRMEWIAALDKIESLNPRTVIAGHKRPGNADDPKIIEETRQYIRDFDRINASTNTRLDLYNEMMKLHPFRMQRGVLWLSARAMKG